MATNPFRNPKAVAGQIARFERKEDEAIKRACRHVEAGSGDPGWIITNRRKHFKHDLWPQRGFVKTKRHHKS